MEYYLVLGEPSPQNQKDQQRSKVLKSVILVSFLPSNNQIYTIPSKSNTKKLCCITPHRWDVRTLNKKIRDGFKGLTT